MEIEKVVEPFGGIYTTTYTKSAYVVKYDEEGWYGLPADTKLHCFNTWTKEATPLGCERIVLMLVPDELFPLRGNMKPYVHHSEEIAANEPPPFHVDTVAYVNIRQEKWAKLSGFEKGELRTKAREAGERSGCERWETKLGNVALEGGRNKR